MRPTRATVECIEAAATAPLNFTISFLLPTSGGTPRRLACHSTELGGAYADLMPLRTFLASSFLVSLRSDPSWGGG